MWTTYWVIVLTFENCLVVKSSQKEKGKLFVLRLSLRYFPAQHFRTTHPAALLSYLGERSTFSPRTPLACAKKTEPIGETGSVYIEIGEIVKPALLVAMRRDADTHIGNAPDAVVAHSLLYGEYLSFP